MSTSKTVRALIAASLLLGSLWNPMRADASRWQQYLQKGASIVRQGIQIRNSASGGYEGGSGGGGYYHQSPPQQAPDSSGAPNSPGSNYYNIDPGTMRNPLRRAQPEPPPEQPPAYTPPPSYQRPYSSRSAYHTGSDNGSEPQQPQQVNIRMPNYAPVKRQMRAHAVVKHVDKPERAAVEVQPPSKPLVFEKDVVKPATAFDTSWIMPAVDRMEMKIRKGST
ncbi:MAG: hypothetical protein JST89_23200 [Cyanobacteria bacterium SZAS-4]|nr:hypothetical protein [Cyanobacteria bacterium SZAS-4]